MTIRVASLLALPLALLACSSDDDHAPATVVPDSAVDSAIDSGTGLDSNAPSDSGTPSDTSAPSDASDAIATDVGEVGETSSKAPLYAPCTVNDDCESMLCGAFPSKGPHCTKTCTTGSDCPAPSPGCNAMGICRLL